MKGNLFYYLLILTCLSLFSYELVKALFTYYEEEVVTKTSQEKQEDYPRPMICISSKYLMRMNETRRLFGENFTHADYQNGKWIPEGSDLTEEAVWGKLSPNLSDLVDKLLIQNTTNSTG